MDAKYTLMDATHYILDSPDPAKWLALADDYMVAWNRRPADFVLPRDHAVLAPVIEAFASDFGRFVRYVRSIRDELTYARGTRSMEYRELQRIFRVLEVRRVQIQRRERLRQANEWLMGVAPKLTALQRQAWRRQLEQSWNKQRLAFLKAERQATGGALTEDRRRELLDEFWAAVDTQIKQGVLPAPN